MRLATGFSLVAVLGFSACDSPRPLLCGEIPQDGCPLGRGGTCDDPYCAALYDCVEGDWTQVEACDNPTTSAATSGSGGGLGGQGGCSPVMFDRSQEVAGCTPDLQEPDCPADAAETCPSPCLTGCVDFFLCEPGGWVAVAFCGDDGLVVTQGQR